MRDTLGREVCVASRMLGLVSSKRFVAKEGSQVPYRRRSINKEYNTRLKLPTFKLASSVIRERLIDSVVNAREWQRVSTGHCK